MTEETKTEETTTEEPTLESVTKETEDALYSTKETELKEEVEPEKTTLVSEDPIEDEVTDAEEDKSKEESKTPKSDKEEDGEIVYDLALSEESLLDKSVLEEVKTFAKENKLSSDAAKSMLEREENAVSNFVANHEEALDLQIDTWRNEVESDKEMGGENFSKTKVNAKKAVERFGGDAFTKILNETGYGNNPDVVRFLSNIGELMSSDTLVIPKGGKPAEDKPMHEYFYGS